MDKSTMINAMKASISEVLEQMFFLPIDRIASVEDKRMSGADGQDSVSASVGFNGSASGTFLLSIPANLAAMITADFLGTQSQDLSTEQINETVMEMVNMLAGNSLSAYAPDSPINLQIPKLVAKPRINGAAGADPAFIHMDIETLNSRITMQMSAQSQVSS